MDTSDNQNTLDKQIDQDSIVSSTPTKAANQESTQPGTNSLEGLNLVDELNLDAGDQKTTQLTNKVLFGLFHELSYIAFTTK